jgi:hypothetical protein
MKKPKYTRENDLVMPFLMALVKKGGEAPKYEVYPMIPDMVQLTNADLTYYRTGRTFPEYGLTLDYVVARLRRAGILQPSTHDGWVRLTDAGRVLAVAPGKQRGRNKKEVSV